MATLATCSFAVFLLYIALNLGQGKVDLTDDILVAEAQEASDNDRTLKDVLAKEAAVKPLSTSEVKTVLRAAKRAEAAAAPAAPADVSVRFKRASAMRACMCGCRNPFLAAISKLSSTFAALSGPRSLSVTPLLK